MHVPEHDGTQDFCVRGVRTALQRQIQTVSGDTTNVSGDFFYPLSVIILNPYSVLTSDISLSDIAEDVAGYIIKSCEEKLCHPSRDAKSCVSRATNAAITAISSLQVIAQPYVSRATNATMTAISSPQVIAHHCASRATNATMTAKLSPQIISHPCVSRTTNAATTVTSSPLFIVHPCL